MKRIITTIILTICVSLGWAQVSEITLKGIVQDDFLLRGMFDCHVTVMRSDSTAIEAQTKVYEIGSDSTHITTVYYANIPNIPGTYLVRVQHERYEDGWESVTVPQHFKGRQIEVPTINLHRAWLKGNLPEVTVRGTRIKVRTRGDTLVFDASAFQMPEGSMLGHLIEQLPGASINEQGEIFINGRKIDELTLNSRSLFKGNKEVLLENLPYFTVKELKVYERQSVRAAIQGREDENPDYVMDVNLKDEYNFGGIANAEQAYGTHDRYQTRGFGILLTDVLAVGASLNLNNLNDANRVWYRSWRPSEGIPLGSDDLPQTRSATALSIDYQSKKKSWGGFSALKSETEIAFDRYRIRDEQRSTSETFLPVNSTWARNLSDNISRSISWQLREKFHYLPWAGLNVDLHLIYWDKGNRSETSMSQWNDDPTELVASQHTRAKDTNKYYGLTEGILNLTWKRMSFTMKTTLLRSVQNVFNQQSSYSSGLTDYRHEMGDLSTTDYRLRPHLNYWKLFGKSLILTFDETYEFKGEHRQNDYYALSDLDGWGLQDSVSIDLVPSNREALLSVFDAANSSSSRQEQHFNTLTPGLLLKASEHRPFELTLSFPFIYQNEHLDYRREQIDTTVRRNCFTLLPLFRIKQKDNRWIFRIEMHQSTHGLRNMIPYRDSRNPLYVIETNPHLKDNKSVEVKYRWNKNKNSAPNLNDIRVFANVVYHFRSVAKSFTYNNATGAYIYRPENVEGNFSGDMGFYLTRRMDQKQKWWLDNEFKSELWHSIDYVSDNTATESILNKVETVNLNEKIKLRYSATATKASLSVALRWRRTWGHNSSQTSINAFDYNYVFSLQHTLASWRTTLKLDANLTCRSGYSSSEMNKDVFILNAAISQPIFRGKVTFTLEAQDLLKQRSSTIYEVNAQGRTETWHRTAPQYILLRVAYNFNKKPKKL